MATWNDYKKHVRESNPEIGRDIDEVEERAKIVSAMIDQRHNLNLSQRDLAEMCGLPHSSVARIESGKSSPNQTTQLKNFDTLGLTLTVQANSRNRMSSIAKRQISVPVHRMGILPSGFFIVAPLAQRSPVVSVPEQFRITTVRNDISS